MTKNESKFCYENSEWSKLEKKMLEPFVHQVSGRAHMLTLNSDTLCKSLSKREWSFYNKLPASLRLFTPRLKGLLFVHLVKNNCSSHGFIASNQLMLTDQSWIEEDQQASHASANEEVNSDNPADNFSNLPKEQNDCWKATYDQTLFKGLERVEYNSTDGFTGHAWTVDKDQEAATEALGKNPWALRQHQREINRTLKGDILRTEINMTELCREVGLHENGINNEPYTKAYLLLGDITHTYKYPSILDLKIGTQLDRCGCSPAKRDKHFNLVQKSSTGSLGLRLAGMQVFQVNTKEYLCRDKYYGRGLSTKGFIDALTQFLHNGERLVTEAIAPIVDRIKELRAELERLDSYRFHASSVLIIYESESNLQSDALEQTKIQSEFICSKRSKSSNSENDTVIKCSTKSRECSVHMIDFAHSTFQGFLEDKTVYQGPDKDCLHALDNLISVLNNILAKAQGFS